MTEFLSATRFVEAEHPSVVARVQSLGLVELEPRARAAKLFEHVRSDVRYEFMARFTPEDYFASRILEQNQGFCVQKAVLLAALGRAAGIPTAIVLCDMRDHALPEKVVRVIGTNVMHHHGLNAFLLDGTWLTVDASLDPRFLDKKSYPKVSFDGTADALLSSTTTDGKQAAEYLTFTAATTSSPSSKPPRPSSRATSKPICPRWSRWASRSADRSPPPSRTTNAYLRWFLSKPHN